MTRRVEILDVAERLLEAEGLDALTMRRLGLELGMQAPSLYKHVPGGKEAIVTGLQVRALEGQATALAGQHDLEGLARAYRSWALAHPRLYELISRHRLDRQAIPAEVEAAAAAPLLAAVDHDLDRARGLWGLAHGLVDLELAGRFPPDADLDAAWTAALTAFGTTT